MFAWAVSVCSQVPINKLESDKVHVHILSRVSNRRGPSGREVKSQWNMWPTLGSDIKAHLCLRSEKKVRTSTQMFVGVLCVCLCVCASPQQREGLFVISKRGASQTNNPHGPQEMHLMCVPVDYTCEEIRRKGKTWNSGAVHPSKEINDWSCRLSVNGINWSCIVCNSVCHTVFHTLWTDEWLKLVIITTQTRVERLSPAAMTPLSCSAVFIYMYTRVLSAL